MPKLRFGPVMGVRGYSEVTLIISSNTTVSACRDQVSVRRDRESGIPGITVYPTCSQHVTDCRLTSLHIRESHMSFWKQLLLRVLSGVIATIISMIILAAIGVVHLA